MDARYSSEIDRLYLQMYPMLFEYARSSLSSDVLAEEAIQDTFLIACQKPEAVCESPNPQGWLVTTLKHVISNKLRCQAAAKRILLDYFASNIDSITVSSDRISLEILYENVADLEEFKLLKELALDGMSCVEIAEERGISISACRKRIERAKKVLRKKIHL